MAVVTLGTNLFALNAQTQLGKAAGAEASALDRLASGLRINRAVDDAAGLAISSSLNIDARVADQAGRNVSDGVSFLNIAEGATQELKSILIRLRELSTQSANGTVGHAQRGSIDAEAQELQEEYNRIIRVTNFNDVNVFQAKNVTIQAGYGSNGQLTGNTAANVIRTVGTGSFQAYVSTNLGASFVQYADANGDGNLDVTGVSLAGTVHTLYGNGDGTFKATISFDAVPGTPSTIAIGDLNDDGFIDVALGDAFAAYVSVLLGVGDGTFKSTQSIGVPAVPGKTTLADVDGDYIPDLIVAGTTAFDLFIGNGDGTFRASRTFESGSAMTEATLIDVNGDSKVDAVFANTVGGAGATMNVMFGNGNGSFKARTSTLTGTSPGQVMVADFSGDGFLDIVTSDIAVADISIFLGTGSGTFGARRSFSTGLGPRGGGFADFNGDGKLDVFVTDFSDNTTSVLLGNGNGTFLARTSKPTGNTSVSGFTSDLNGDGAPDILAIDGIGFLNVNFAIATTQQAQLGVAEISGISLATKIGAKTAMSDIDDYLDNLNLVSGAIGASMSRLGVAANTLAQSSTEFRAASSRIQDADIAVESANAVRAKILKQAAVAVLGQANQQPALALKLL